MPINRGNARVREDANQPGFAPGWWGAEGETERRFTECTNEQGDLGIDDCDLSCCLLLPKPALCPVYSAVEFCPNRRAVCAARAGECDHQMH